MYQRFDSEAAHGATEAGSPCRVSVRSICPKCEHLRLDVDELRGELGEAQLINEGLLERLRATGAVIPKDLESRVLGKAA